MPNRSIRQAQDQLLDSGFLDLMDSRAKDTPVSFGALADELLSLAVLFAETGKKKLQEADRVAAGGLEDSIVPTNVEIFGSVYEVAINLKDYYDFVNKGVKGWKSAEKAPGSPYQFKDGVVSKKMMQDVRKWLIREGMSGKRKANAHPKAPIRDRKRASITETSNSVAYAISSSIKAKGLKASHFWDDTVTVMTPIVEERLQKVLVATIINNTIQ